jgi:succinate dehydrogenase flavin-adding protein (antitoxin of CptAB toxin-antitoxin module)
MHEDRLDWSKLPPHLQYLAEPAARYGVIQFETRIMAFLKHEATDADIAELRTLQPLVSRDEDTIFDWIDELGMTRHREAALIYFLLHLMALGKDAGLL